MPTIDVQRTGKDSGTLTYTGGVSVSTTCWWDPKRRIPENEKGYLAAPTHMASKTNSKGGKREGFYLSNVPGFAGIFVHMGTSPAWSDGCIVIPEDLLLKIWEDARKGFGTKEEFNTVVKVVDVDDSKRGCSLQG